MKALLVTSRTTFVPGNYDGLVLGLASCPEVCGLLVLDNRSWGHVTTGLGLITLGARGIGAGLIANHFGRSQAKRKAAYQASGKKVWTLPSVNTPEALALVKAEGIDLIINARTRDIYRGPILQAPRLGCINIHHGLLPAQRGTMCDLWALAEGEAAGFSFHYMTAKIDAGELISSHQVSTGGERDYPAYLRRAVAAELAALKGHLATLAAEETLPRLANQAAPGLTHRRNPSSTELRRMLQQGMIL